MPILLSITELTAVKKKFAGPLTISLHVRLGFHACPFDFPVFIVYYTGVIRKLRSLSPGA